MRLWTIFLGFGATFISLWAQSDSTDAPPWDFILDDQKIKGLCPLSWRDYTREDAQGPLICQAWGILKWGREQKERFFNPPPLPKKKKVHKPPALRTPDNLLSEPLRYHSALNLIRMRDKEEALQFADVLNKPEKICRYPEISSAVLDRLDVFLPDSLILEKMEKIYQTLKDCLNTPPNLVARINMMMGLLAVSKRKWDLAYEALWRSSQVPHGDLEPVLFWLGVVIQKRRGLALNQDIPGPWLRLIDEFPYNYYSVLVYHLLDQDPIQYVLRPHAILTDDIMREHLESDDLVNRIIRIFREMGQAKSVSQETVRLFSEAIWWIKVPVTQSIQGYELGSFMSDARFYRGAIYYLNRGRLLDTDRRLSLTLMEKIYPFDLWPIIEQHKKTSLDTHYILALIRRESAFDTHARSHMGALGLMQVIPSTAAKYARRLRPQALLEREKAIEIGTQHLDYLSQLYNGHIPSILAAYNAGDYKPKEWKTRFPTLDVLWMGLIPYRETREYVSAILGSAYWYQRLYKKLKVPDDLMEWTSQIFDFWRHNRKTELCQDFLSALNHFYHQSDFF